MLRNRGARDGLPGLAVHVNWIKRLIVFVVTMAVATLTPVVTRHDVAGAVSGWPAGVSVYVGYADNEHGFGFPSPWYGDSNVVWLGCPGGCALYDGGVVSVVNNSTSSVTVDSLTASVDTCTYSSWPANTMVGAGQTAIYAQQTSGATNGCAANGTFDTSDIGPGGQGWSGYCSPNGIIPSVTVSVNQVQKTLADTQQVLNTGGIDLAAGCGTGVINEAEPWIQLTDVLPADALRGGANPSAPQVCPCSTAHPVNLATGEFWHRLDELDIPGRGPDLAFDLSYDSATASASSAVGYGWTFNYGMALSTDTTSGVVTITQENGSTVPFTPITGGGYTAPGWADTSLAHNADGTYTFSRNHGGLTFTFSSGGSLTAIRDRNGYTTTLAYSNGNNSHLTTATDSAGRTLSFGYDNAGHVNLVTDNTGGRSIALGYNAAGELTSVTDVRGGQTSFTYDGSHQLLTLQDPRNLTTTNTYTNGKVTQQQDPKNGITTFSYVGPITTIKDPRGNTTEDAFSNGELVATTRGVGTSDAATWTYKYDPVTFARTQMKDPNGHVWKYAANSAGERISTIDPLNHETDMTYNSLDELKTVTRPIGVNDPTNTVTTTYSYDAAGNLQSVSRPLYDANRNVTATQTTTYAYDPNHAGDVISITDPNQHATTYGYDPTYGFLTSRTTALGEKTTYSDNCTGTAATGCFPNVGFVYSKVSPRGNVTGANPAQFTTTYAYDAAGDVTNVTDPLGHSSQTHYDLDGNVDYRIDANNHRTDFTYDELNDLTKMSRPDGTALSYSFDANGNRTDYCNAAEQTTTACKDSSAKTHYVYDALDRLTSSTTPPTSTNANGITINYAYDGVGNLKTKDVPGSNGRITTTFTYYDNNWLQQVSYSDTSTPPVTAPSVSYTYYDNGARHTMTDGDGTTTYTIDSLDRLTSSAAPNNRTVSYGYDLAGNTTGITYPGQTAAVTRHFNNDEQLDWVTDWQSNKTTFDYTPDGLLQTVTAPNGISGKRSYDNADELTDLNYTPPTTAPATPTVPAGLLPAAGQFFTRPAAVICDTRNGTGFLGQANNNNTTPVPVGKLAINGGSLTVHVLGEAGIPADHVGALAININVVNASAGGYLTVNDNSTTSLTYQTGSADGLEVVTPDTSGNVTITSHSSGTGTFDLEFSIRGYFSSAGMTTAGDTYQGFSTTAPQLLSVTLAPGGTNTFAAAPGGTGTVPDTSVTDAVALDVIAKNPTAGGWLSIYPADTSDPQIAVANFANQHWKEVLDYVRASPGSSTDPKGYVTITNHGSATVDVVVRARGYFQKPSTTTAGTEYVPVTPYKLKGSPTVTLQALGSANHTDSVSVQITGTGGTNGIPATGVSQALTNLNPWAPTLGGYLSMYPGQLPNATDNNVPIVYFAAGDNGGDNEDAADVTTTSPSGWVTITNHSSGTVNVNLFARGYFATATTPTAPTSVTAGPIGTGSPASAVVTWATPASDGGAAITRYTVTASPGGQSATVDAGVRSATITGLTKGTAYTFTVTAANAVGTGSASSASNRITAGQEADFQITPGPTGLTNAATDVDTTGTSTAHTYGYTSLDQLQTDNTITYGYNPADDPNNLAGVTQTFDSADELLTSGSNSYSYTSDGDRSVATPGSGTATTYGYNAADELSSWTQGSTSFSYTYDGNGLRSSVTAGAVKSWFTYDDSPVPNVISDGTNNYIYGPAGLPLEQVDSTGTPTYLHQDARGETRFLSNAGAVITGTYGFAPYGSATHSGSATTPLQFGAGYTDPTGLVYLQARYYDSQTAQFLTRDPSEAATGQPYQYANDDPLDLTDPTGLDWGWNPLNDAKQLASDVGHALTKASVYNPVYDAVNAVAIVPYAVYYSSYRNLSSIGSIPVVGKALTYTPPVIGLYATQWLGLKADEGIDVFKNWAFCNGEKAADEGGPIYPTSIHHGPEVYGPGLHDNGRQDLYPSHSYPWWDGFSPNRDPNAG